MADVTVKVTVSRNDLEALARKAEAVLGRGQGLEFAWRGVGMQAHTWAQGNFFQRSKGRAPDGIAWAPLASVTVLFRRGVQITTMEDFMALGASGRVGILSDTGVMERSFRVETLANGVQVVQQAPYAVEHHEGHEHTLTFRETDDGDLELVGGRGENMLSQHVPMKLGDDWNHDFFKIKHALLNMQGSRDVPARPILTKPPEDTVQGWLGALEKTIEVALGGAA